jgi:pimeloyl-ACP methyl ester carboxylesterase
VYKIGWPPDEKNQDEWPGKKSPLVGPNSSLLNLVIPTRATAASLAKEIEVNGVRLSYVEQGSGEPIVFVHGVFSDLRVWEPVREEVAKRYRFIAYTQRYHGVGAWKDDGKEYSTATHANDLAKFITWLNVEPVHLVGRSAGGRVAMTAALRNPALVRTLALHEPEAPSVLPTDSAEGKAAREDWAKVTSAAIAANRTGDPVRTMRLFIEAVYQLEPGGFGRLPEAAQRMLLDNARTAPLMFGAPPPPAITCDELKTFTRPTLVTHGEKTQITFKLINERISQCVPGAQQVAFPGLIHNAPSVDPAAFTAVLFEFMSKRQGL